MHTLFLHYLTISRPVGYVLIFFGMMFEGDLFLFSTSFLTKLGYFDIFDFIWAVLIGTVTGDCLWYWLGYKFGNGNNKISLYISKHLAKINVNFKNNFFSKLLLSKFMYGTHHIAVAYIGRSKINLWKYLKVEIPATLIWLSAIGGLGYIFGSLFSLIKGYLKFAEIALVIAVLIYLIISEKIKQIEEK